MRAYKWSILSMVLLLALVAVAVWVQASVITDTPKAPSLRTQWIVVMAVLLGLCLVAGYTVNGRIDGILVDDRNRLSLSRLQWVLWFVVLISTYFVGTVLNVTTGQADPFPTMQGDLFGLIGFATGSAVLSNIIVDTKKSALGVANVAPVAPTPAAPDGISGNKGNADINEKPWEASWQNLYCGEEPANRDIVDVSRLQQLVTTVLLVTVYVGFVWRDLDTAAFTGHFAKMPEVNTGFLGLLGASHAGYLAYKATPKSPPQPNQPQQPPQI